MTPSVPVSPTAPTRSTPGRRHSLAQDLERRRLSHRAVRIRRTLEAMRQLVARRDAVPPPLRHGMDDFQRELLRVERRLHELEREEP